MSISKNLVKLHESADSTTIIVPDGTVSGTLRTAKEHGREWYESANLSLQAIDTTHDIDTKCSVCAILSPACSWDINLRDASNVLQRIENNYPIGRVSTYGANLRKAIRVIKGEEFFKPLRTNLKTYSFYRNLMLDKDYVTIDRHAIKALIGSNTPGSIKLSKSRYMAAVKAYQDTAKYLGYDKTYEFQAVIWLVQRTLTSQ